MIPYVLIRYNFNLNFEIFQMEPRLLVQELNLNKKQLSLNTHVKHAAVLDFRVILIRKPMKNVDLRSKNSGKKIISILFAILAFFCIT